MPHPQSINLQRGLDRELTRLGASAQGAFREGWHGKSLGVAVSSNQRTQWLRIKARPKGSGSDLLWNGEREAAVFDERVRKPKLLEVCDWDDGEVEWRSELMTLVVEPIASRTPDLQIPIINGARWFDDLGTALVAIASVDTDRVAVRQDLVTRRIHALFGLDVDITVRTWVTAHGDLNWTNLTSPRLWILDWESWGKAPAHIDLAFLLAFSLSESEASTLLRTRFANELSSFDGRLAQRFACAELLHMSSTYGDHSQLVPVLNEWAKELSFK
jgi:hypothetical protein